MTYRFKLNETVSGGACRIGLEQIEIAETRLASRDDIATAVHDARRCLKRLRALLRLVRPALPESTYRREANRVAGIGRLLADARDRHVMQQTMAKLEVRYSASAKVLAAKLNKMGANGSGARNVRASAQERRQALEELEKSRKFFAGVARRRIAFEHLAAGVERSYRRARRKFHEAYENSTDEAFHEWRKTVQQHWRHMQLLSRGWPDVLGGRADEAKELSRLLGEDHDIHVLLTFAAERGKAALSPEELAVLKDMGRTIQDELRGFAKPRGARLFAEPAGQLKEHLVLYWSAAHDLSLLAPKENGKETRATQKKRSTEGLPAAQAASRGERAGSRRSGR